MFEAESTTFVIGNRTFEIISRTFVIESRKFEIISRTFEIEIRSFAIKSMTFMNESGMNKAESRNEVEIKIKLEFGPLK